MYISPYSTFSLKVTEYQDKRPETIIYTGLTESVSFIGCGRVRIIPAMPVLKVTQMTKFTGAANVPKPRFDLIKEMTEIERALKPVRTRKDRANRNKDAPRWIGTTTDNDQITLSTVIGDKLQIQQWISDNTPVTS